jgi:hypothetical protein
VTAVRYQHTQSNRYVVSVFVVVALAFAVALLGSEVSVLGALGLGAFLVIVGLVLANFSQLTVTVDDDGVELHFGWGWPRKHIELADIAVVDTVRNKWWYGFGIRLTPHGWLYNVWGLDAVQLDYHSGTRLRIGTDEPELLVAALRGALAPG